MHSSIDFQSVQRVIRLLQKLGQSAGDCNDAQVSLSLSGATLGKETVQDIVKLQNLVSENGWEACLNVTVDGDILDKDTVDQLIDCSYQPSEWKVVFSKDHLQRLVISDLDQGSIIFFVTNRGFDEWSSRINPLTSESSPFQENRKITIFSPNVTEAFGGPYLAVLPLTVNLNNFAFEATESSLPRENLINEQVHVVPSKCLRLVPRSLHLTWGNLDQDAGAPFLQAFAASMAACLVDVLYSCEKAVIKGIRHFEAPIFTDSDSHLSKDALYELIEAVSWAYEERIDTRRRLLADRFSLDFNPSKSLILNIEDHIHGALLQAKDQYRFVVLDRKDEYAHEVRILLQDIRKQSELYAEKSRSIIAGLSRDALAAFIFVAVFLSVRLGQSAVLIGSDVGEYFFRALSGYFVISIVLQASAAIRDMSLSERELRDWSKVTRGYISPEELKSHVESTLRPRRRTFWVFLSLTALIYLAIALFTWFLPHIAMIVGLVETTS